MTCDVCRVRPRGKSCFHLHPFSGRLTAHVEELLVYFITLHPITNWIEDQLLGGSTLFRNRRLVDADITQSPKVLCHGLVDECFHTANSRIVHCQPMSIALSSDDKRAIPENEEYMCISNLFSMSIATGSPFVQLFF